MKSKQKSTRGRRQLGTRRNQRTARSSICWSGEVWGMAEDMMDSEKFNRNLSVFLAQCVRERYAAKHPGTPASGAGPKSDPVADKMVTREIRRAIRSHSGDDARLSSMPSLRDGELRAHACLGYPPLPDVPRSKDAPTSANQPPTTGPVVYPWNKP